MDLILFKSFFQRSDFFVGEKSGMQLIRLKTSDSDRDRRVHYELNAGCVKNDDLI